MEKPEGSLESSSSWIVEGCVVPDDIVYQIVALLQVVSRDCWFSE